MNSRKPIVKIALLIVLIVIIAVSAFLIGSKRKSNQSGSAVSSNGATAQDANSSATTNSKNSYIATNQGLTSFPNTALSNPNITLLDISHNQIPTLPSQIGQLIRLEDMNVSYNKLSGSLPGEIRKMSLKTLNASYNSLTGVPGEIGQQPNLKNINFSYNQITGLPNEIANIPVIDVLDLSYNSIDSISDLSKFKNIRVLKLTGNKLSTSQISQLQAALPNTQIISN